MFGEHLGETVSLLDRLGHLGALLLLHISQARGVQDIGPHVELFGGLLGNGQRIARHHLDFDAHRQRGRDGCLRVIARRIEQGQHAHKLPGALALGTRHAEGAKATRRKVVYGFIDCALDLPGIGRQLENHLRCALRHLEGLTVLGFDARFGALVHRIERLEVQYLVALQNLVIFHAGQYGQINGVVIVRTRGERAIEDHLIGCDFADTERISERQLVLGQSAGLVGAQHVNARQLLDRHQFADDCLFLGKQARADRHRDRQHRRHRHRDRRHCQHQGELQRGENRIATEDRNGNDGRHQAPARMIR